MKLYHRQGAGRPIRIRWALEEAGIDHDVEVMTPEQAAATEHQGRQPLGRVPVIDDGDGPLFESAALLLHVGDLAGEKLLPPPGTRERALVYQWVLFVMTEVEPPFVESLLQAESDPERAAVGAEKAKTALGVLEQAIGGREHIVGDRFTAADLLVTDIVLLAKLMGGMEPTPGLAAYIEPHAARPGRKRAEELFTAEPTSS